MRQPTCVCGTCKKCKRRIYVRQWWDRLSPDERRSKTSRRDPKKVREQHRRKMAKRYAKADPEFVQKQRAREKVRAAVRKGTLQRGTCEVGIECHGRVEAHHEDYSLPLEVRWLCAHHHRELERPRT